MRAIVFAAAAMFSIPAIALSRGGGGVLNPASAPAIEARPPPNDTGSAGTPNFNGAVAPFNIRTLLTQSSAATMQTPNSLPRGAAPASTPEMRGMDNAQDETVPMRKWP